MILACGFLSSILSSSVCLCVAVCVWLYVCEEGSACITGCIRVRYWVCVMVLLPGAGPVSEGCAWIAGERLACAQLVPGCGQLSIFHWTWSAPTEGRPCVSLETQATCSVHRWRACSHHVPSSWSLFILVFCLWWVPLESQCPEGPGPGSNTSTYIRAWLVGGPPKYLSVKKPTNGYALSILS